MGSACPRYIHSSFYWAYSSNYDRSGHRPARNRSFSSSDFHSLGQSFAIASDKSGNIYIADSDRSQVLKVTPAGSLTLIAGNGFAGFSGDGGLAVNASLKLPQGVTVGSDGAVYIGDSGNDRVRKVATDGTISTFAGNGSEVFSGDGGQATSASLNFPAGLSFDAAGISTSPTPVTTASAKYLLPASSPRWLEMVK